MKIDYGKYRIKADQYQYFYGVRATDKDGKIILKDRRCFSEMSNLLNDLIHRKSRTDKEIKTLKEYVDFFKKTKKELFDLIEGR